MTDRDTLIIICRTILGLALIIFIHKGCETHGKRQHEIELKKMELQQKVER